MKWKPVIVAIALAVCIALPLLPPSASASSGMVDVSPAWLEISGTYGDWVNKTVTISNNGDDPVNVSVEPSSALSDMYVSHPYVTVGANSTRTVTLGVQMDDIHGYVTYTWQGGQFNQFVLLTPSMGDISVTLLNKHPNPGDTVGFMLSEWVSGSGYVYIPDSDNIHNFEIQNGMAFTSLSSDDSGTAVAVFTGEGFMTRTSFNITGESEEPSGLHISAASPVDIDDTETVSVTYNDNPLTGVYVDVSPPSGGIFYKNTDENGAVQVTYDTSGDWDIHVEYQGYNDTVTVNVEDNGNGGNGGNGDGGELSIDAPGSVSVGGSEWITLTYNGDMLANHPINIRTPEGAIEPYSTNSMGQLRYTFNDVGDYRLTASYNDMSDSHDVTVDKTMMDISGPSEAMVNTPVTLTVDQGAAVTVEGPAGKSTGTATGSTYTFTPAQLGTYTVKASTTASSGSTSFKVMGKPTLRIFDMRGNHVANAVKGELYTVSVTYNGDTVNTDISVTSPSGFTETLNNTNTWQPRMTGRHTVNIDATGYYKETSIPVEVVGNGDGGLPWGIIAVIVVFACAAGLYFTRDKWYPVIQEKREQKKKDDELPERAQEAAGE